MMIKNKLIKSLFHVIIFVILFVTKTCQEYRSISGEGNNKLNPLDGVSKTPFIRELPSESRFADQATSKMISTPGEYGEAIVPDTLTTCSAQLPANTFPLPRCVSNKVAAMTLKVDDSFNFQLLEKFKSKRKNSHILTYWAFFVRMDIVTNPANGPTYSEGIYIPQDDKDYLSSYRNGPSADTFGYTSTAFPFNRSVADGGQTGVNMVTSFLDASTIYGNNEIDLQKFRDVNNNGKMKLEYLETPDGQFGYPPQSADGELITGITAKTKNVFTDMFATIFLREHNRLCDDLFKIHGNNWDDEKYFQEARRWVIAFIQRITYYEYLGTALGSNLPPYKGYNPDLRPIIDTFFASVTFRYAHSEISDFYNMVNERGDLLSVLSLHDIKMNGLLTTYGVPTIALSLALQIPIYVDIAALDLVRGRDHGIPSYNDARVAFGLSKKLTWAEISSDPEVQKKLEETYGTIDRVEAFMGGLAEDHVNGGNYGELFSKSFVESWSKIRDSDRFWYENKDAGFSKDELSIIQKTTLLQIFERNTPQYVTYPQNLWFVQPPISKTKPDNKEFKGSDTLADGFNLQWTVEGSDITFLITMNSENSWFGIGFNPNTEAAMLDTDMMIFYNQDVNNKPSVVGRNYKGIGRAIKPKELPDNDQILTILDSKTKVENGITQVLVKRPLNAKNRKSIDGSIEMVYAWNPTSNVLTFHAGNRGKKTINFRTGETSNSYSKQRKLLLMHGIVMFIIWGILFPGSVWIVRYLRHKDSYMSQHRNLNLFGGAIVATFGAVAMSAVDVHAASPHAILGLIIFTVMAFQIALGLLAIWGLANVESAATGVVRHLKHLHFYLGAAVLIAAWTQIFLGLIKYDADKAYIWTYLAWLILIGFVITASEFYYKIKNMQFLWPVRQTDDSSERIRACIPHKFYEHLPAISWSEFNQRVMTGASLVIAEGLVFDIHKWIPIHPGGQKILQRVIGTDITNDFFFDPSVVTVINRNFSNEYDDKQQQSSISVLTDNNYKDKRQHETKHKPYNMANAVDMINSTAFRHRRVAMHRHSKFATSKLATMVIARILDSEEDMNIKGPPSVSLHKSELLSELPHQHSPHIFRRYILTNIETASRYDAERPVKKFTFQVIHPKDRLPRFLPGDYIEIMSYANNQVAIRPYTPLQGPTDNSFCILVKIYKDGVMSQHLNRQLRNFEIKVRGPFDIADRVLNAPYSPSIQQAGSIISRPSSPSTALSPIRAFSTGSNVRGRDNRSFNQPSLNNSGIGNSNIGVDNMNSLLDGRSGILLNKERDDLCWEHLFMVCGGTGITPMLQLIQYHLDKSANANFNLYLLNANDTIADLIQPKYLDYLCQILKGKLKITYILSKPPPIWRGLTGMIDETLLYDWISQNYSAPPPAIPPRLSVASGSGSVLSASTLISNSYQHHHTTSGANNSNNNQFHDIVEVVEHDGQDQIYNNDENQYDPQHRRAPNRVLPPPIQVSSTQSSSNPRPYSSNSQYIPYYFSPLHNNALSHQTNEMIMLNERHNYMKSLSTDTTQIKLIVCGSSLFNDNIRKCLEKLGFPIDEKAIFIN
ncbi:15379_t:CDS:10 [Funneliformis mosseae]|uniref:15379_t:CDS:1 n=1 Tax=Funneliformis mosseae TaxID=27381 RepID=A0A9N9ATB2_FUNMO|nr:15379_t:CDS:10 [Funneliformis mosseae]